MTKAAAEKTWTLHEWADGTKRSWTEPEGFTPPYSLPGAGEVVFIGTNTTEDIRPTSLYSQFNWHYSLFGSFGSGCFVEDYSQGGAYAVAGTGGHNAPPCVDAVVFDFADETWKHLVNANGVTVPDQTDEIDDYTQAETTGGPYYEITGSVVPAPAHPYMTMVPIPASLGGGTKGSIAFLTRTGITVDSVPSNRSHRFDLNSRLWSRWTEDDGPFVDFESQAILDAARGRYYLLRNNPESDVVLWYLDPDDGLWKSAGNHGFRSAFGSNNSTIALDPVHDVLLQFRGTAMQLIDLTDVAGGWASGSITGTLPTASQQPWAYHPTTGKFYYMPSGGGTTLYRLTPPASSPLSNAWTVDTITLGTSVPAYGDGGAVATGQYKAGIFYVPAIDCLARIVGNSAAIGAGQQVALINPE